MKPEESTQQLQAPHVLVVFPSREHRASLLKVVTDAGMLPLLCDSPDEAREAMKSENIRVVICEDLLPPKALRAVLKQARNLTKPIPVIVASRTGEWKEFLTALRQGAFDYLVLPPRLDEVKRVLGLALAEGSRTETNDIGSGVPLISERNPPFYKLDDRWAVRFRQAAPVLSRPLLLRAETRET